jgi:nitrous oxide reductase accessory protein NosL
MTEQRIAGWTSPNGDITIQVWDLGNLFQVREFSHLGSFGGNVIEPYATEAEARAVARAKAEIIRWNQTGR